MAEFDREFVAKRLAEIQCSLVKVDRTVRKQRAMIKLLERCRLRHAACRVRELLADMQTVQRALSVERDALNRQLPNREEKPVPATGKPDMPEQIFRST